MKTNRPAVGYVRVSRVGGRGGDSFLSPDLQREEIARAAAREGLEVAEIIEELDASGGDSKRPGWNRALELVERGGATAVVVYNISRASRSVADFLDAEGRLRAAGGRLISSQESLGNDATGVMTRNILLAIAQMERERARENFAVSTASAVERGIHVAGTIPLGYLRDPETRRLVPDPDTAPVVLGMFERRAKGWSWAKVGRWAAEHGHDMSEQGVAGLIRNPVYLGQARYGDAVKDDAHEAIVPRSLWRRCQRKARPSARTGVLTERYLLQGVAVCANCARALYLSGGQRKNPYYFCRQRGCDDHAYAQAAALDSFVLNTIEERLTGRDYDGVVTGRPDAARWHAATFVPRPGGDDADVAEAEEALADAKADLDGFLADTSLRSILGTERYNEAAANFVAVVNKCEADLDTAREASSGSFELVGRLWLREWGWAERKEWIERIVRSVVVQRGREPLSRRAEVELR